MQRLANSSNDLADERKRIISLQEEKIQKLEEEIASLKANLIDDDASYAKKISKNSDPE